MTTNVTVLVPAKYVENSITTQYTADNVKAVIDKFTVTNISAGNITFDAYIVITAGTAGSANQLVKSKVLIPNQCYNVFEIMGHSLPSGSFIATNASSASSLVMYISGRELS